jgi:predicted nuclease with RNAse H fold
MDIFVGIDVACARSKPLPICIVQVENDRVVPLEISERVHCSPGNAEISEENPFRALASNIASIVQQACEIKGWRIIRIAIDAPAAPPSAGPRRCEVEMSRLGLSSFQTPTVERWSEIRKSCIQHLEQGRPLSRLPHANNVWMLYGFELFSAFRSASLFELIEVYPYSIVSELVPGCPHKTTVEGYRRQLDTIAQQTGWIAEELERRLKLTASGSKHDRLDAFMAAWVASLPAEKRRAYGNPTSLTDPIWAPDREKLAIAYTTRLQHQQ